VAGSALKGLGIGTEHRFPSDPSGEHGSQVRFEGVAREGVEFTAGDASGQQVRRTVLPPSWAFQESKSGHATPGLCARCPPRGRSSRLQRSMQGLGLQLSSLRTRKTSYSLARPSASGASRKRTANIRNAASTNATRPTSVRRLSIGTSKPEQDSARHNLEQGAHLRAVHFAPPSFAIRFNGCDALSMNPNPVLAAIDAAPLDSRPETDEERMALAEVDANDTVDHAEVMRSLASSAAE
jgi:hypothetical protein